VGVSGSPCAILKLVVCFDHACLVCQEVDARVELFVQCGHGEDVCVVSVNQGLSVSSLSQ